MLIRDTEKSGGRGQSSSPNLFTPTSRLAANHPFGARTKLESSPIRGIATLGSSSRNTRRRIATAQSASQSQTDRRPVFTWKTYVYGGTVEDGKLVPDTIEQFNRMLKGQA